MGSLSPSWWPAWPLGLAMRREDPGPVNVPPGNVPPGGDVGERLAALAGQRPWWPLVEPTPRWIRVRIGGELVAGSRRALLHVQYGRGALPRSFLPACYVPVDDVLPGALVDPVEAEAGLTVWAVAAAGLRADDAAWMHHRPPQPLEVLAGLVTFSWLGPLTWFEEEEPLAAHAVDPHKRVDVLASSRAVRVEIDGVLLAESHRPLVLFETALPVRYYLPPGDVRIELVLSQTRSACPYKGAAAWWSARIGGRGHRMELSVTGPGEPAHRRTDLLRQRAGRPNRRRPAAGASGHAVVLSVVTPAEACRFASPAGAWGRAAGFASLLRRHDQPVFR